MRELLFDGRHAVNTVDVLEKMKYFIKTAEEGMEVYKNNKKVSLEIAKGLRHELEGEYKNNRLKRIQDFYKDNELLTSYYESAVHESSASITGKTSYENLFSFLCDVKYYMKYYSSQLDK